MPGPDTKPIGKMLGNTQKKRVAKDVDVERVLSQAANLSGCDMEEFRSGGRVTHKA